MQEYCDLVKVQTGPSARGFNGQYSNKLLVLIDGRTGYKPLLSGVFWDTENVQFEDIGRIEVIRGVGATVGSECSQRRRQHHHRTMEITDPDSSVLPTRIEHSGLVKLTWRF